MILANAHLIARGDFPDEFKDLLVHTARMEFVMQVNIARNTFQNNSVPKSLYRQTDCTKND